MLFFMLGNQLKFKFNCPQTTHELLMKEAFMTVISSLYDDLLILLIRFVFHMHIYKQIYSILVSSKTQNPHLALRFSSFAFPSRSRSKGLQRK